MKRDSEDRKEVDLTSSEGTDAVEENSGNSGNSENSENSENPAPPPEPLCPQGNVASPAEQHESAERPPGTSPLDDGLKKLTEPLEQKREGEPK